MNMKKIKKFFTLSRRAEGFTLVELIVVIAILAILGGVAVPAYSGYVKKANMQADMSLISEIEQAMTLAYYSGTLPEGDAGYVLLFPASSGETAAWWYDTVEGSNVDVAMANTFGANWASSLFLKYDNWSANAQTLSSDVAANVVESNFVQLYTPEELMSQVQAVTNALNGLEVNIGNTKVELYDLFGYEKADGTTENAIDDVIEQYGITKSWDEMNSTERSNVLVLASASSVSNENGAGATGLLSDYALYTAYAAENDDFNAAYQNFQTTINNVDPGSETTQVDQIKAAYQELKTAATSTGFDSWNAENGEANKAAFESIMAGVGNAMTENGDAILADLGNENMFTTGAGSELYNDYLNRAYASSSGNDDFLGDLDAALLELENGAVIIQYAVIGGKIKIVNTLPAV